MNIPFPYLPTSTGEGNRENYSSLKMKPELHHTQFPPWQYFFSLKTAAGHPRGGSFNGRALRALWGVDPRSLADEAN